jgi:hypothetical protein
MIGSAEIHAALAVLLYNERPSLAFRAEEVRCSNDGLVVSMHYSDLLCEVTVYIVWLYYRSGR